jgi:uncharacterized surface protein with fasciclin (FAS1) repeats
MIDNITILGGGVTVNDQKIASKHFINISSNWSNSQLRIHLEEKMKKVIYVAVILSLVLALAVPALAKGNGKSPGDSTIYEIASGSEDFETLTFALEATGLDTALNNGGQFTVFAPTDDAFAALPDGTLEFLIANPEVLKSVLLYHVTDGRRWSNSLVNKNNPKSVEMLSGGYVHVTPMSKVVDMDSLGLMSPDATIVLANINASNGVVHVIDEVLIP